MRKGLGVASERACLECRRFEWLGIITDLRTSLAKDPLPMETARELLGHRDVGTITIHAHVLNPSPK